MRRAALAFLTLALMVPLSACAQKNLASPNCWRAPQGDQPGQGLFATKLDQDLHRCKWVVDHECSGGCTGETRTNILIQCMKAQGYEQTCP